jgi:uncharacterized membrane protein
MNTIHELAVFEGMPNTTTGHNRLSKVGTENKQILHDRAFAKKGLYLLLMFIMLLAACSKPAAYSKAPVSGEDVTIDAQSLQPGIPQFFTYSSGNRNINFFVIKIDNEVLSFLDACLSCETKLGYTFSNGHFTCKECGIEYSVSEIKSGIGSCYPIRLTGTLRAGKYYISVLELKKSA